MLRWQKVTSDTSPQGREEEEEEEENQLNFQSEGLMLPLKMLHSITE